MAANAEKRSSAGEVYFYTLKRKFVDENYDVPQESREILYYSLAMGHHIGVVDCLKVDLSCSRAEYEAWIEQLDHKGEAYRKMKGFARYGEITIDPEHIHLLAHAFTAIDETEQSESSKRLTQIFMELLAAIHREPTKYLMVRGR